MNYLKTIPMLIAFIIGLILPQPMSAQEQISLGDFQMFNNTSWGGTLTYLDYQSGKFVPVATTMQVIIRDKLIEQNVQYTWEPTKNIQAKTKIKKNGTYLGDQKVISKTILEDGSLQLLTSYEGKDGDRSATMYYTYQLNKDMYKVTKEVQFKGSNERFVRNSYSYKKL